MQRLSQPDDHSPRQSIGRLNRLFGELNASLLAIAIGLAALDFTCFAVLRISTELTRASSAGQTTSPRLFVPAGDIVPGMKMLSAGAPKSVSKEPP
ncbi:MAG: hypothetical protein JO081_01505 [Alphaproteobacteria bacterium]|nr:hypothetical protein [Alphaproteobacteria bacterium]